MAKLSVLALRCNASVLDLHDKLVTRFMDRAFPTDLLLRAIFTDVYGIYIPFVTVSGTYDATFTKYGTSRRRVVVGYEPDQTPLDGGPPRPTKPIYGDVTENYTRDCEIEHHAFSFRLWASSTFPYVDARFLNDLLLQDCDLTTDLAGGFYVAKLSLVGKHRDLIIRQEFIDNNDMHLTRADSYSNLRLMIDPTITVTTYYYPILRAEFQYLGRNYGATFDAFRNKFVDGHETPDREKNPRVEEIRTQLTDWKQVAKLCWIPPPLFILLFVTFLRNVDPLIITLVLFAICIACSIIYKMITEESPLVEMLSPTLRTLRVELARLSAEEDALEKENRNKFRNEGGKLKRFTESQRKTPRKDDNIPLQGVIFYDDATLLQELVLPKEVKGRLKYLLLLIGRFNRRLIETRSALQGNQPRRRERKELILSLNDENKEISQLWDALVAQHGTTSEDINGSTWQEMVDNIGLKLTALDILMAKVLALLGDPSQFWG
jgi:hypothetical protein